jgi:uncharacterized protein (UPF0332 family)
LTDKEALFLYRWGQAEETLADAENMVRGNYSPRSVVNRAYYSLFYALLALLLKADINVKTSKHAGIISMFDREFIHTGKIDKRYSMILHKLFEARQRSDYKEFVAITGEDASLSVQQAREFLTGLQKFLMMP